MINEQICSRGLIPQTRRNIWCIIRLIIPAAAERSHAAAAEYEHIFILHLFFGLFFYSGAAVYPFLMLRHRFPRSSKEQKSHGCKCFFFFSSFSSARVSL